MIEKNNTKPYNRLEFVESSLVIARNQVSERDAAIDDLEARIKDLKGKITPPSIEGFRASINTAANLALTSQIEKSKVEIASLKDRLHSCKCRALFLSHDAVALRHELNDRDLKIKELSAAITPCAKNNDQEYVIEVLKGKLDRSKIEHLAHLNTIIQMLSPLAVEHKNDNPYLTDFGKAAMVNLIQQVIQEAIRKLAH